MSTAIQEIILKVARIAGAMSSIAFLAGFGAPSDSTGTGLVLPKPRVLLSQQAMPTPQPGLPNQQAMPDQQGLPIRRIAANAPNVATVGPDGGRLHTLSFAVVGATGPAIVDDTASYPTSVISTIWRDVQAFSPHPAFAVTTGEYMFANSNHLPSQAGPQLDLYLAARAFYQGPVFPVMSNHECAGNVASNCGNGNANGLTSNYSTYIAKMLQPIGKQVPYYVVSINSASNAWTSKFVFIACNAWDAQQSKWLVGALSQPTTYTFIVRNEPTRAAGQAPCLSGSGGMNADATISRYPYTLQIAGHRHTASHNQKGKEIIVGNGGAPLVSGNYGYVIVQQQPNGNIRVDFYDLNNVLVDRFVVDHNGSPGQ